MDKKWIRRVKLMAIGLFIGFLAIWIGVMIAGAMSDETSTVFGRVLKK